MNTRRKFLQAAGLSAATVGLGGLNVLGTSFTGGAAATARSGAAAAALQLGIAGYTFAHVPLDQGIAMMKRVGVGALSIKDFYLPMDSNAATIQSVKEKFSANGIKIYAA